MQMKKQLLYQDVELIGQDPKIIQSQYSQKYIQKIGEVQQLRKFVQNNFQQLQNAGFYIKFQSGALAFTEKLLIRQEIHSPNSKVIDLTLQYGCFIKNIKIFHSRQSNDLHSYSNLLSGFGSYGQIYTFQNNNVNVAVKCMKFKKQFTNQSWEYIKNTLYFILKQYFLLQLLSALRIGPKVLKLYGFDLVVFEDCVQYSMQACNSINFKNFNINILQTKLKKMHALRVVHRDIKPQNIMHSPVYGSLVFIDFGVSLLIGQKFGFKTKTSFAGTYEYCGSQMKQAFLTNVIKDVDLYYNDLQALQISNNLFLKDPFSLLQKSFSKISQLISFKICNFFFQLTKAQSQISLNQCKQLIKISEIKDKVIQMLKQIPANQKIYQFFQENLNQMDKKNILNTLNSNPFCYKDISLTKNNSYSLMKKQNSNQFQSVQLKNIYKVNYPHLYEAKLYIKSKKLSLTSFLFKKMNLASWEKQQNTCLRTLKSLVESLSFRQNSFRTSIEQKLNFGRRFSLKIIKINQNQNPVHFLSQIYLRLQQICLTILFQNYQLKNQKLFFLKKISINKKQIAQIFVKIQEECIIICKIHQKQLKYFMQRISQVLLLHEDLHQISQFFWRYKNLESLISIQNTINFNIVKDIFQTSQVHSIFLLKRDQLKKQNKMLILNELWQINEYYFDKNPSLIIKYPQMIQHLKKIQMKVSKWNFQFKKKCKYLIFYLQYCFHTCYREIEADYIKGINLLEDAFKKQQTNRQTVSVCMIILVIEHFNFGSYSKLKSLLNKIDEIINQPTVSLRICLSQRLVLAFGRNDLITLKSIILLMKGDGFSLRQSLFWSNCIDGCDMVFKMAQSNQIICIKKETLTHIQQIKNLIENRFQNTEQSFQNGQIKQSQQFIEAYNILMWYKFRAKQFLIKETILQKIQNVIQIKKKSLSQIRYLSLITILYKIRNKKEELLVLFSKILSSLSSSNNKELYLVLHIQYLLIKYQNWQYYLQHGGRQMFLDFCANISFQNIFFYLCYRNLIYLTFFSFTNTIQQFQFLFKLSYCLSRRPYDKSLFVMIRQLHAIFKIKRCNSALCSECSLISQSNISKKYIMHASIAQFFEYLKQIKFNLYKNFWKNSYFSVVLICMISSMQDYKNICYNVTLYMTKSIDYLIPLAKYYVLGYYYLYVNSVNIFSKRKRINLYRKHFKYNNQIALQDKFLPKMNKKNTHMIKILKRKSDKIVYINSKIDMAEYVEHYFQTDECQRGKQIVNC